MNMNDILGAFGNALDKVNELKGMIERLDKLIEEFDKLQDSVYDKLCALFKCNK